MPTITPTHRPGLRAALDRHLALVLDHLSRSQAVPLLAVLFTVGVGLAGAGLTVHLSA